MLLTLFVLFMILGFSWLITCGLVYLIFWCFSLSFSWAIATGIWLILIVLRTIFSDSKK